MQRRKEPFLADESGATTADWVVVLSGLIFLTILVFAGISSALRVLGEDVGDASGSFDLNAAVGFIEQVEEPDAPTGPGGGGGSTPGDGPGNFVPVDGDGGGNGGACGAGQSCSGLGDGTNPGAGSGNNNAGDTPGGTGTDNPGGSSGSGSGDGSDASTGQDGDSGGDEAGGGSDDGSGTGDSGTGSGSGSGTGSGGGDNGIPANPDFIIAPMTLTPGWSGTVTSNWLSLPGDFPIPGPVDFTVSGDGNPTLQTANGRGSSGQIPSWGTNIVIETPLCGTTGTVVIELAGGLVGIWQVTRPAWPSDWGAPPAGC